MRVYYKGVSIPLPEVTRAMFELDIVLVTADDPHIQPSESLRADWGWTPNEMSKTLQEIQSLLNPPNIFVRMLRRIFSTRATASSAITSS